MSIIAGKIALKTRNIVVIMQFIAYFSATIEVVILMYFSLLNEWETALKSLILLAAILIFVFYAAEKKFKQKIIYGIDFILLSYRNVIIKEAEQIDILTDGYSQRPFSREYESIKHTKNFKDTARGFAKALGKEGVIIDWDINENSITLFPGVFLEDFFASVPYMILLAFRKKKLSRVKISSDGQIMVFVSDEDYKRITRPVAYHLLCKGLAEKFEQSFIEFAKGGKDNRINSLKILRRE